MAAPMSTGLVWAVGQRQSCWLPDFCRGDVFLWFLPSVTMENWKRALLPSHSFPLLYFLTRYHEGLSLSLMPPSSFTAHPTLVYDLMHGRLRGGVVEKFSLAASGLPLFLPD